MTETELGLCTSPGYFPTTPHRLELQPPFLRSILYTLDDADTLIDLQVPHIITLNNQCAEVGGDWAGWDSTILALCEKYKNRGALSRLLLLGAGNEFDIYWKDNGSVPPEFGADLARRTARIAHNYNIKVSATSVAGKRWPEYLAMMSNLCRDDIDYFDIHAYGQRPNGWGHKGWMHGDLQDIIRDGRAIANKHDFVSTEYGVKIVDAGGEQAVADFMHAGKITMDQLGVPYVGWFCYTDAVGAPSERDQQAFGLEAEDGRKRPAWYAYAQINEGKMPDPDYLDKWRSLVGGGLLDMMKADLTEPVAASEWRPFDRPSGQAAKIEFCFGTNGTQYYWLLDQGTGYRIEPNSSHELRPSN